MVTPSSAPALPRAAPSPGPSTRVAAGALAVLAAVAATFGLDAAIGIPAHVDRLTVVNETDYDLRVTAGRPGADSVVVLGSVGKRATAELIDLLDRGDVWVLHFRGQGVDAGSVEVDRDDLVAGDWTYTVPDAVPRRLEAAGAPASP